jgi:hypothetical protein
MNTKKIVFIRVTTVFMAQFKKNATFAAQVSNLDTKELLLLLFNF